MLLDTSNLKVNGYLWDEQVQGLHLRRRENNHMGWFLFYTSRTGIVRRPKIGSYPEMPLEEARRIALVIKSKVSMGEDPSGYWKAGKREIKISELFAMVWKKHWATTRFLESGWAKEARRLYTRHIEKQLGPYRMSELTSARIRFWHRSMQNTPNQANRALSVLHKLYSWAEDHDLRSYGTNPCRPVRSFVEKKRSRYATPEELKLLGERLMAYRKKKPREVAMLFLLMLTGARPWSLLKLKKTDLVGNILRFEGKTSKITGQQETVVLPEYAMKHIVPMIPPRTDGMLFGGQSYSVAFLWNIVRKEAGCEDLWSRDLRRTFATFGIQEGITLRVIGDVLNHASTKTTEGYARVMTTVKERAANIIGDRIGKLLEEEK